MISRHSYTWASLGSPRSPAPPRRAGFTLIELLVVITIILIVSAVALPTVLPALQHRQVSEAARLLQAALAGARDAAIRDNAPSGIRLLPDPTLISYTANGQVDQTQPLAYNRWIPIEAGPEYSEGFASTANTVSLFGATAQIPYPGLGGGYYNLPSVLTVYEALYNTAGALNPPTSWFWNIRVGDKIQFNNAGPWYTVVGPMYISPTSTSSLGQNPELFVNVGQPGITSPLSIAGVTGNPEFLFLVNGQDDNGNGWVDEGWDGVDNNADTIVDNTGLIDPTGTTFGEWENEAWLGSVANHPVTSGNYSIQRRPIPTTNGRETSLPTGVVIDASSWGVTNERTRVPAAAFNMYSGLIDIMINPDGSVLPTTLYSSPSSLGMTGAFYHFWLAERQDVYPPTYTTTSTGFAPSLVSGYPFALPMPLSAISTATSPPTANAFGALVATTPSLPTLKGEMRIVTLFAKSGQITTNDNPTLNVNNVNQPYLEAQQGVSGSQQ